MASDFYKFMGMERVTLTADGYIQLPENMGTSSSLSLRIVGPSVLAGALLVSQGTGLAAADVVNSIHPSTNVGITLCSLHAAAEEQEASVEDKLAYIRHYLSLNMTDMARVLRVERPTVYSWMAGKADPHADNLDRIKKIYKLARVWRETSSIALGSFATQSIGDRSIVELLSDETVSELAVRKAFRAVSPLVEAKRSGRQKSATALAAELGYEKPSEATSERLFEQNTFV